MLINIICDIIFVVTFWEIFMNALLFFIKKILIDYIHDIILVVVN